MKLKTPKVDGNQAETTKMHWLLLRSEAGTDVLKADSLKFLMEKQGMSEDAAKKVLGLD